jgi:hypothetical protein
MISSRNTSSSSFDDDDDDDDLNHIFYIVRSEILHVKKHGF